MFRKHFVFGGFLLLLFPGFCQKEVPNPTRPGKNDCKTIDVTTLPGYSASNRYFHHGDFSNSFNFIQKGFKVYQAGPGDTYTWDSIQKCGDIYEPHFTNSGFQQAITPPVSMLNVDEHGVDFLTPVGILQGQYDVAFDFGKNQKTKFSPSDDIGTWQSENESGTMRLVINNSTTLTYGFAYDSLHLPLYKIDQISVDRFAHSSLYDLTLLEGRNSVAPASLNLIIIHGEPKTVLFVGSGGDFNLSIVDFVTKL